VPYITGTVVNQCGTTVNVKLTFTYYGRDCLWCKKIILLGRSESIKRSLYAGEAWVLEEETSSHNAREGTVSAIGIVTRVDVDVAYEESPIKKPFDK
jgi:late competence protein required for DNA uptake (superfamily II DNA/RNA helicase)